MKKIFTLLAAVLMTAAISAQTPDKISYQAVIRNASGNLVTEQEIGVQISILQGSDDGIVVYTEIQTTESNKNGLVSIELGGEAGFADIDWSDGPYFLKTETDPSGGTTYTITGTSQLLSVPYAFHAKTAETISEPIVESDPVFEASPAAGIEAGKVLKYDAGEEMWVIGDDLGITKETDPVFEDSPAVGFDVDDMTNWNTAFEWGDHSTEVAELSSLLENHTHHISDIDGTINANPLECLPSDHFLSVENFFNPKN